MELPQTGGCQCGQLRYVISAAPKLSYACHCTACQSITGSAFSMALIVNDAAFRLSGPEPRAIRRRADSGRIVTRLVCPECGSWVCSTPINGNWRVRSGTLDDTSWVRPTAHFWTRSKQPWVVLPPADVLHETQPSD